MTLTAVETIALITILLSLTKIITVMINPQAYNRAVVKKFWKHPHALGFFSLILALVVLYYLIQEITIVQIFASIAFMALLMVYALSLHPKDIVKLTDKFYKDRSIIKHFWIYLVIWIILLLWGLKVILM
jgi:hypothetical protein